MGLLQGAEDPRKCAPKRLWEALSHLPGIRLKPLKFPEPLKPQALNPENPETLKHPKPAGNPKPLSPQPKPSKVVMEALKPRSPEAPKP